MSQENLLLVEGDADKSFFDRLCKKLKLAPEIQVAPPKDLSVDGYNSKQGVLNHLKVLLQQIDDGNIKRLAIVVDADYEEHHGLGSAKTLQQIKDIVEPYDFKLLKRKSTSEGFCFKHLDGLSNFGAWIMPNNEKDGMLEDWIKSCKSVKKKKQALFSHAEKTIKELSSKKLQKFKKIHTTKSEVATWLAWQKPPAYGFVRLLDEKDLLLDENSDLYTKLTDWLKHIYPAQS